MRAAAPVLVLLLAAPVLAGCLVPGAGDDAGPLAAVGLSEALFAALPGEHLWLPASADGAPLHLRIFRPDAPADWEAPVLLVMSPYFNAETREDPSDPASPPLRAGWLLERFVPRGYAVAYLEVRGTGESGGCLEQTAALQAQDGYDVVEWLGTQPWSNGRVGTFGKSYDGEAQQATATLAPPHLVTMVPVASVSGQYEYGFYDGVPFASTLGAPTPLGYAGAPVPLTLASNLGYAVDGGLTPLPSTEEGAAAYPSRAGCHPGMLAQGLDASGDWSDYWEAREIRKGAADVQASLLYVHGLQDWNVKPVATRDWFDAVPSEKRAILGQWAHDYPHQNRVVEDWSRHDWVDVVHRWFDHWLLGIENGILDDLPPVQVQDTAGVWRREAAWPPRDVDPVRLHLGDGVLAAAATAFEPLPIRENEEAVLRDHVGAPVPTVPPPAAPPNEVLVFEGEPLDADLHLSGWPTLTFNFTVTASLTGRTDPHFAFVLHDVDPAGESRWINRGYLSARHRDGVEAPREVPMGETITYTVRFFPQDDVVPAGHRLRLTFAGSDDWTLPEGSFWAGTLHDGVLTLPAIERDWDAVRLDVPMGPALDEPRP